MRIEANHLIALRQLTLPDENVSSPVLLLRASTYTHAYIYIYISLSTLFDFAPANDEISTAISPSHRYHSALRHTLHPLNMHEGVNAKILEKWRNARETGRETAADSLRDRKSSSFERIEEREREKISVDYLSRDQLCSRTT